MKIDPLVFVSDNKDTAARLEELYPTTPLIWLNGVLYRYCRLFDPLVKYLEFAINLFAILFWTAVIGFVALFFTLWIIGIVAGLLGIKLV